MLSTIVIEYTNILKQINIESSKIINNKINILDLCKLCNFRKDKDFDIIYTWNLIFEKKNYNIQIWGRNQGKPNMINNYIFPDKENKNIYGNCIVLCYNNSELIDLNIEFWNNLIKFIKNDINVIEEADNDISDEEEENNYNEDILDIINTSKQLEKDNYILSDTDED